MRHLLISLVSSVAILISATAQAAVTVGKPAPEFKAEDINGKPVSPSFYKGNIIVLEWTNPDCPFVHKHYDTENMQQLQSYAQSKKVVWLTINSGGPDKEGHLDVMQARDYINTNKVATDHYILDSDGKIGKLYGAKTTPHMFVIDAKGNIAYMGAIDNNPTPDKAGIKGADNYVRDAIDSLLSGKPIAVSSTQSYGCSVKYAD